jgi:hypothetical protein
MQQEESSPLQNSSPMAAFGEAHEVVEELDAAALKKQPRSPPQV